MPAEVLNELDANLTLEQLENILRSAEKQFVDDTGRTSPAEVVSFSQGTVEGRETNVATFLPCTEPPPPLRLLGEVPVESFERERFFQCLGKHGFELICFSDVLVEGKSTEVAVCRALATSDEDEGGSGDGASGGGKIDAGPGQAQGSASGQSTGGAAPGAGTGGTGSTGDAASGAGVVPGGFVGTGSAGSSALISKPAFDLIVEFEGLDQPGIWPGESSGISLGVGYDLGYVEAAQFERDWAKHLSASQMARLKSAIGKKARAAAAIASRFIDIRISRAAAMEVFTAATLPLHARRAFQAFPGMEKLPANAQGALVSLVFNRGPDTNRKDPRRREMAEIKRILQASTLPAELASVLDNVAGQIRSMKRLWDIRKVRGLHRRRDAEAELLVSAAAQATNVVAAAGGALGAAAGAALAAGAAAALNVLIPRSAATGERLVEIARRHCNIGERYVFGAFVPKNDAEARGPWDCAEFVSWCVFQAAGFLYGCEKNDGDPRRADAYTGYWERDARKLGRMISVQEAAGIPGAVLLRFPPRTGIGHIAFSDGEGGTLEAKGRAFGVVTDVIRGRRWDTGVLLKGITYGPARGDVAVSPPAKIYFVGAPGMDSGVVTAIQDKLRAAGFDPGASDGDFGDETAEAVLAFQLANDLLADGEVGPETARVLGVTL